MFPVGASRLSRRRATSEGASIQPGGSYGNFGRFHRQFAARRVEGAEFPGGLDQQGRGRQRRACAVASGSCSVWPPVCCAFAPSSPASLEHLYCNQMVSINVTKRFPYVKCELFVTGTERP